MENINGIMKERKVENVDAGIEAYYKLYRRALIDGRWLASQPKDSAESKRFIGKEVHEINKILSEFGLDDHDEVDERDTIIAIEEMLTFVSRLYSRGSDKLRSNVDKYIEESDSD